MLLRHFSIAEIGLGPNHVAIQKETPRAELAGALSKGLIFVKMLDLMPFEGHLGELCARLGIFILFLLIL